MSYANAMSTAANPVMPQSHVGFDSITTQIERKLLKRGFQFNIICVGVYELSLETLLDIDEITQDKLVWENRL